MAAIGLPCLTPAIRLGLEKHSAKVINGAEWSFVTEAFDGQSQSSEVLFLWKALKTAGHISNVSWGREYARDVCRLLRKA